MTLSTEKLSLDEYFSDNSDPDHDYELENGELVVMPPESELNRRIATFLFAYFLQLGIPPERLTMKTEIVVSGIGTTVRLPDLMILSEELVAVLAGASRSTVLLEMPPPQLVVEVVSPGKKNEDRDYRYKRSEYGARGIANYWIVDPIRQQITVLTWVEGLYEAETFQGNQAIISSTLPNLNITTEQILQAGQS